jgi:ankyrin repeat protein
MTGAHFAAYFGLSETTIALLKHGHNPDVKDIFGRMPLSWAAENGHDSKPATWVIIDRTLVENGRKGLMATYESDPFFCFHTINAYEEPSATDDSKTGIVADLTTYENLDVI